MRNEAVVCRECLCNAQRIVVKVGTRLLANETGKPEPRRIKALIRGIVELQREGKEVILVSSGAIGMGLDLLGRKTRPTSVPDLQMAAAVGQARLMAYYEKLFATQNLRVGQVLLTHNDLNNRVRHLNARNTIVKLLRNQIIPIVNENDAVAVDELTVGDNDVLGALVAVLTNADALVVLTNVNGLYRKTSSGRTQRIPYLERVTKEAFSLAKGKGSALSVGGMSRKLEAAQQVVKSGGLAIIADGRKPKILQQIFRGEDVGTLIGVSHDPDEVRGSRKRWIAFFHRAQGKLIIDEGARNALELKGKSLLPIGVREVQGQFPAGSLVNVIMSDGTQVARGLVDFSSEQIEQIKGIKTNKIAAVLGRKDFDEVIHRDNMVVLRNKEGEIS